MRTNANEISSNGRDPYCLTILHTNFEKEICPSYERMLVGILVHEKVNIEGRVHDIKDRWRAF